ncbi:MAG: AAA family ATPase [Gammaproteobacteria bacterium]|nr:AAA family ATPase [Gammaproteobacteria bacterium]
MEPRARWHTTYWLLALMALLFLQSWWQQSQQLELVPYSEFEQALADGRIVEVTIADRTLTGRLAAPDSNGKKALVATRVEPDLVARLDRFKVPYSRVIESTFLRDLMSWIVPVLVFAAIWLFVVRRLAERQQGMGGFMSVGKSRAKIYVEKDTGVTFADVAGVDEAKGELQEVVGFLKTPGDYGRLGARIPKGVLLVGPPGTGKTLLARAVAGEAGVPFFSISGSEFVEMFVGVGAARVRDLFEQARQRAPALIEAALAATRRGGTDIGLADFTTAIERIVAGLEKKSRVLNPRERDVIAHHEMGHALVALSLPGTDPVHKVSIIPRGIGALGYTIQRPTEDRYLMSRAELEHKIAVLMGGRAAEHLVFGELSTGAADDLAKATDIAHDMITRYGMDEALGFVVYDAQPQRFLDTPMGPPPSGCQISEATQGRIDAAVRDIVMTAFHRAEAILGGNREILERGAQELLVRETLDEMALKELTKELRHEVG